MAGPRQKPVYAFIDSQNLNLAIHSLGWKLDFSQLHIYLKDKFKVKKAFLFIGYIKENQNLYEYLKQSGYHLIFKPTITHKIKGKEETKGNVDAELVLHSMIQFPFYSGAIIISGDGDFHCLIEYLQQKNKLERLIVPNQYKYSALLRRFSDKITFLNPLKKRLLASKTRRGGH